MKRSHKSLDVITCAQLDYLLPEGKASVKDAWKVILPGIRYLTERTPENSIGVLFVDNVFSEDDYDKSEYAKTFPAHCLVGGLSEYDPIGVQNVFSYRLLNSRGVNVFHAHKHGRDMWTDDEDPHATSVHVNRGGSQTAVSIEEFTSDYLDKRGVNRINIWGASPNQDIKCTIAGFLKRGFSVRRYSDLCFHNSGRSAADTALKMAFEKQYDSDQLLDVSYADQLKARGLKPL